MKLDDEGLDRVRLFGQPYHGLWKAGSIALLNGTQKPCPAPIGGGVTLLRVPGQPPVSRTTAELAADAAAGREWRDYGLISGGRYGAMDLGSGPGYACVLLIDASNVRWNVRISKNASVPYNFNFSFRRFGHVDGSAVQGWSSSLSVALASELWDTSSLTTIAQNTTGREFVIGATDGSFMGKVTISGTVDLVAPGFGLQINSDIIEYETRNCRAVTTDEVCTGVCTDTVVELYNETRIADNSIVGTYVRTRVYVDGVLTQEPLAKLRSGKRCGAPVVSLKPFFGGET